MLVGLAIVGGVVILALLLVGFQNGYFASVIHESNIIDTLMIPEKFEIAVLDFNGDLDYTTPIGDEILRYQTKEEILETFKQISELPPKNA